MKARLLVALLGLAISFALPTFAQEQSAVDPKTRQEIEAVEMQFVEAYNKHDAAAVAALYTHDAVRVDTPPAWVVLCLSVAKPWRNASRQNSHGQVGVPHQPSANLSKYAFEDSIATISEWSIGQYNGHSVQIFVRDADTGTWKIRLEYRSIAPVVTH